MTKPKKCAACNSTRIDTRKPYKCLRCGYFNTFARPAEIRRYRKK